MNEHQHTNRLSGETSPYLVQHSHNPVDWYPWGDEAFAKAKAENKPVLVSIGYSACHWCHVMEHESFEDEATAEIADRTGQLEDAERKKKELDQLRRDLIACRSALIF